MTKNLKGLLEAELKKFKSNFPTKEQVVTEGRLLAGNGWDFTGYFGEKLEEFAVLVFSLGQQSTLQEVEEEIGKIKKTEGCGADEYGDGLYIGYNEALEDAQKKIKALSHLKDKR